MRHGESEGNVLNVHQDGSYPLTEKGREQAEFIAHRVSKLPIEVLIVSPMIRTRQTAEVITHKTGLVPEFSELFVEARSTSEQIGKRGDSPESISIADIRREHFEDLSWHYSDEENYGDLIARAHAALAFLESREETNICVVTHGDFMRFIVAAVLFGKTLTAREAKQLRAGLHVANTGVTVLGFHPEHTTPWSVWMWNDHAHLGE